ncbi:MAG: pyruvate dehydrogenase complex dihydrolipoamide acetyltransferase [Rhodothermales bacterium]
MAIPVEMPKMSDTMEEGVLVSWLAEEGAPVSAGDVIAQVETDKATMDLEVYDDGVLLKRVAGEGDSIAIGGLIAILGNAGEDVSAVLARYGGGDGAATEAAPSTAPETTSQVSDAATPSGDGAAAPVEVANVESGRLKASPLARRMASEHGLNLASVSGSGPDGRIVRRDVERLIASGTTLPAVSAPVEQVPDAKPVVRQPAIAAGDAYEAIPLSQMRKAISRRLSESKFTAPHFYLTVDVDMEQSMAFRKQLNELAISQGGSKISFNDLITKSCALALRQHPYVNASYLEHEGEIRLHNEVHVAIAVAIDEGLITPVIRNADNKGLGQISAETKELAGKARDRKLQPHEFEGSTFSTSNLGMFGIEEFTAIINPPNACIMAIGAIRDVPVVKDGAVVPGKRMKLSLSCDHRVVDGATGAQFLNTVKQYLEQPMGMML